MPNRLILYKCNVSAISRLVQTINVNLIQCKRDHCSRDFDTFNANTCEHPLSIHEIFNDKRLSVLTAFPYHSSLKFNGIVSKEFLPIITHISPNILPTHISIEGISILDNTNISEHKYENKIVYWFNKLRNDSKHRKRAFTKRGYWRRRRAMERKENSLRYAYAIEGIDYDTLEKLRMGEIPELNKFK